MYRRRLHWDGNDLFRMGSNRSPSPDRARQGMTVYVVIRIDRQQVRAASPMDRQEDIDVLGVFFTRRAAQESIDARNPLNRNISRYVIHETVLDPPPTNAWGDVVHTSSIDTFHPEIYG